MAMRILRLIIIAAAMLSCNKATMGRQQGSDTVKAVVSDTVKAVVSDTVKATEEKEDTVAHVVLPVFPSFPGGKEAMQKYIEKNLRYPQQAKEERIEERVIVAFIVEKDGGLSNVRVIDKTKDKVEYVRVRNMEKENAIRLLLYDEALRLVKGMPKWIPARKEENGEIGRMIYYLPIEFFLTKRKPEKEPEKSNTHDKESDEIKTCNIHNPCFPEKMK